MIVKVKRSRGRVISESGEKWKMVRKGGMTKVKTCITAKEDERLKGKDYWWSLSVCG